MKLPLYTHETLLKFIGGLHSYLRHTILMFNPNNLDEVCVQSTHIEMGGRSVPSNFQKKFSKTDDKKGKGKKTVTLKKEGERPTCTHCKKDGHEESKCWKLHPEF